jgi:hypothetical protein
MLCGKLSSKVFFCRLYIKNNVTVRNLNSVFRSMAPNQWTTEDMWKCVWGWIIRTTTSYKWNLLYVITNMETVWNFEVISEKFNKDESVTVEIMNRNWSLNCKISLLLCSFPSPAKQIWSKVHNYFPKLIVINNYIIDLIKGITESKTIETK